MGDVMWSYCGELSPGCLDRNALYNSRTETLMQHICSEC